MLLALDTVYVIVTVGDGDMEGVISPVFQLQLGDVLFAVNVAVFPIQMLGLFTVKVGDAKTVMMEVAVSLQ